jgi:hypothetical protein
MCVGSRVHLVGASISFEKNFYRLPFILPSLVCHIGPSVCHDSSDLFVYVGIRLLADMPTPACLAWGL